MKKIETTVDEGVAAVFGQDAIEKAAQDVKGAVSAYGAMSKAIRKMLGRMITPERPAADIAPEDRAEFVAAACDASGVDCEKLNSTGIITRIAKEMGFPVAEKAGKGANVVKINCKTASVKDVEKAVKAIVKAMVKNGANKAELVKAIAGAVA